MAFIRHRPDATTRDVNASQQEGRRHGGIGDRHKRGEYATVLSYQADKYTATVRTERGRTMAGIPRMRMAPGEMSILPPGTEVLISYDYGNPIIMGVLPAPASSNTSTDGFSVTGLDGIGGQGENRDQLGTTGNFRQANEPTDVAPGDYGIIGQDGNSVSVLNGGMNVVKSSPLSQIRTHLVNDLVEVISRNYRHITDMGELTIHNDEGRVNLKFRGASDQRNEAGPDEEKWTIRLDLGSEGDMFNFELTTPQGQTLFKFHVDSEGAAEIYGINGVTIGSGSKTGGSHNEEHTGNSTRTVLGDRSSTTNGSEVRNVDGNVKQSIGGDYQVSASNDVRVQALRDFALSSGRNMFVAVQGGTGDTALQFDVEAGDWVVNVGSSSSPNSAYTLNTAQGDITFNSPLGGNFNVTTPSGNVTTTSKKVTLSTGLPDSVILGGDALLSHIVKYEELSTHLATLYALFDSHVHVHAGTAVVFGIIPVNGLSGPPLIPVSPALIPAMQSFRSLLAGVSG